MKYESAPNKVLTYCSYVHTGCENSMAETESRSMIVRMSLSSVIYVLQLRGSRHVVKLRIGPYHLVDNVLGHRQCGVISNARVRTTHNMLRIESRVCASLTHLVKSPSVNNSPDSSDHLTRARRVVSNRDYMATTLVSTQYTLRISILSHIAYSEKRKF